MIFDPTNFEINPNERVHMEFDNALSIDILCVNDEHCVVKYGYADKDPIVTDKNIPTEELGKYIKEIIETMVTKHGAKPVKVTRSKKQQSEYKSVMEILLKRQNRLAKVFKQ